jgi:hypothetical protein
MSEQNLMKEQDGIEGAADLDCESGLAHTSIAKNGDSPLIHGG